MISEEDTLRHLTHLRGICETLEHHPTFFEITLALAMKHFVERECELIILETGMGGRLDATTAVPADVCVITPIGLDHTQWLGDTIGKIAAEKAGIILEKVPVISAPQHPDAAECIAMTANEKRAPLTVISSPALGYALSLSGSHQSWNAAAALAALHALGIPLRYDSVQHGLAHTRWPGRFESISVPHHPPIILDGAHNPHAAAALVETWKQTYPNKKASLVFSAVCSKDIAGLLDVLATIASHIHLCPVQSPRAVPVAALAAALPADTQHSIHKNFPAAFHAAAASQTPILICGSLYLVGQARAFLLGGSYQPSMQ
jgi:dihydrofolate synthase/folylpolyglutamate synthase